MLRKLRLHQKVDIPEPGLLDTAISTKLEKFLSYNGESLFGDCGPTNYIISLEVITMGKDEKKEIFYGD